MFNDNPYSIAIIPIEREQLVNLFEMKINLFITKNPQADDSPQASTQLQHERASAPESKLSGKEQPPKTPSNDRQQNKATVKVNLIEFHTTSISR